jgi:uncharacterized protein (TIGR02145 family)
MKMKPVVIAVFCIFLLQIACKKEDVPTLKTFEITNITMNSASSGGHISNDGGSEILACGVCWSLGSKPTINDDHTEDKAVLGTFSSQITGLETALTYFVRAYATNKYGTGYGEAQTVSIQPPPPIVITAPVSSITATSALCGGTVTATNGIYLYEGGICWSTSPNPTINDNYTHNLLNNGVFVSTLSRLKGGCVTYYARSFVLYNLYGTTNYYLTYGNEVSFQTGSVAPSVETGPVSSITVTSATIGVKILSDGCSPLIKKGICLDTIGDPSFTSRVYNIEGSSDESTITLTNLREAGTYYFRGFASNANGTVFGDIVRFVTNYDTITDIHGTATDIDGNIYHTIKIGRQIWMKENLRTTRYNDNSDIPLVTVDSVWTKAEFAYCWWGNTPDPIYGCLYNWNVVNTGKLCPDGWHVPTYPEFETLIDFLGDSLVAGKKLKEAGTVHWVANVASTSNASGFTALPGGDRRIWGDFEMLHSFGYWWSTTRSGSFSGVDCARALTLGYNSDGAFSTSSDFYRSMITNGYSIRCISDETVP